MGTISKTEGADLKNIRIHDGLWKKYVDLVRNTVIPYQWEALNDRIPDAEPSYAIRNFRIAAGEEKGEFGGFVFQDSDPAKWLEAVGYSLAVHPDPELEEAADSLIDLIGRSQQPDGYLNTYFTIKEPDKRWTNLTDCHELYCAGHLMEAAVAYYNGTGKRAFLEMMCRYADYIDTVFGPEHGKMKGYCGHEEVELALIKLYKATGNEKYLKLAGYFIDERGKEPNYFVQEWETRGKTSFWNKGAAPKPDLEYFQAHKPVREQTDAVGHSVRAVYLYTAMADLAAETGDEKLLTACKNLWGSIVQKRMYITGGIGSSYFKEAFTFDYDLPNDTVYQETCASIGLIFFAHRMLKLEPDSSYADVMERALFNSVISGMGQDGRSFFYVNPLEVLPEASEKDPGKRHIKPVRQKWYGCACCPPNVSRLLASLGSYIYTVNDNTVYTHLYISGEAELDIAGGKVSIVQQTDYPWSGDLKLKLSKAPGSAFSIGLRIPGWCRKHVLKVNGEAVDTTDVVNAGYALINRYWKAGDVIECSFDMPVELIEANPQVRQDSGKVAIQRGPLVFCLEEADNGKNLASIKLDSTSGFEASFDPDFLGGAVVITGNAVRTDDSGWEQLLYRPLVRSERSLKFRAIPYYLWANRGLGEMQIWTRYG